MEQTVGMRRSVRLVLLAGAGVALVAAACPTGEQRRGENLQCGGERGTGSGTDNSNATCTPAGELGLRCEEQFVLRGVADVIWVIDNSGSMAEEIKGVQDNVTRFVDTITGSGVDLQTVFVSARGNTSFTYGISVTESANVHAVDAEVDSVNGPEVLLAKLPQVEPHLRADATKHIIFVTDDNSTMSSTSFLATTDSAGTNSALAGRVVHAVAGFSVEDCPDIAAVGSNYDAMVTSTGGMKLPICCQDYTALLDILAGDITATALSLPLSHSAAGNTVRVFLVEGTEETELTMGWHFDAQRKAVVFEPEGSPAPGSTLRVRYSALD